MSFDKLIQQLETAKTSGDRLVTLETGDTISVSITSDIPFDAEPQKEAINASKIFEEILLQRAEKALSDNSDTKVNSKKKLIPGMLGGDILKMIRLSLKETVRANMGKNGALVNRSGQFLNSVAITKVIKTKDDMLEVFFTYMKFPYSTFSTGGRQYSSKRDPNTLIAKSIKEIASKALIKRLKAIPT